MLTNKQRNDILNALKTGSGVPIRLSKTQRGGFLGTLLAGIAAPLAIEAIKKLTGGSSPWLGKPVKKDGGSAPRVGVCINHRHFLERGNS